MLLINLYYKNQYVSLILCNASFRKDIVWCSATLTETKPNVFKMLDRLMLDRILPATTRLHRKTFLNDATVQLLIVWLYSIFLLFIFWLKLSFFYK